MKTKCPKVVTFGELLLWLDTHGHERFLQAEQFTARYTGGEANVAVALAQWGVPAFAVSKVPEHEIGQACVNMLRRYGVNTDYVLRGGDAFAAGLIYAMMQGWPLARAVEFATAAGVLKHSVPGDFNMVSLNEVQQLVAEGGSGRVQR